MKLYTQLLDLDEAVDRLGWGVNAVGAVAQAIQSEGNAYSGGLQAVWEYLYGAHTSVRPDLDLLMMQNKPRT